MRIAAEYPYTYNQVLFLLSLMTKIPVQRRERMLRGILDDHARATNAYELVRHLLGRYCQEPPTLPKVTII